MFHIRLLLLTFVSILFYACGNIVTLEDNSTTGKDVNLLNIKLGDGLSLNEPVDTNTTDYTTNVAIGLTYLDITDIEASPEGTQITLDDSPFIGRKKIPLKLGDNKINLLLTYKNMQKTYHINVIRGKGVIDYLKASNTDADDRFGTSVAIDGDTVVVSADSEDSNATGVDGNQTDNSVSKGGAVYVFRNVSGSWIQEAYLKASSTDVNDYFGRTVAIDGDTIVVGATGEDSNATGVNGDDSNNSAFDSGAVYVFERSGSTWTQTAYLKASNASSNDWFGTSIAIDGDTIVVGATGEDSNATGVNGDQADNSFSYAGAAYVFERSGSTWTQTAYLKASNTKEWDNFAEHVAISGDTIVVGAPGEDSDTTGVNGDDTNDGALSSGAAFVFRKVSGSWTQEAYLKASNTGGFDAFGSAVAIDGDTLIIGAYHERSAATGVNGDEQDDTKTNSGAAYVFERSGSTWTQTAYIKASNTSMSDQFGISVDVLGDSVLVGAYSEDSNATGINGNQGDDSFVDSGAVYLFKKVSGSWTQDSYLKASNTGPNDLFGCSVGIDNGIIVVGASAEDSNATGINGNQNDDAANNAGSTYIFE